MPLSRVATICLWMNSIEPTSTPRVGWAATSSRRSRESSRATTTFCWLPPERLAACGVDAAGADVVLLELLLGELVAARPMPQRAVALTNGDVKLRLSMRFSAMVKPPHQAVDLAVLGDEADAGVEDLAHRPADQLVAVEA